MIKVNGVLSTVFLINFHFLLLVKLIECIVEKKIPLWPIAQKFCHRI